jgi:hypothetical protein
MICHGSTAVMSVLVALTCCPSAARSPPRMALSQSSRSWSLKPTGRLNSCWARRHARTPGALGERRGLGRSRLHRATGWHPAHRRLPQSYLAAGHRRGRARWASHPRPSPHGGCALDRRGRLPEGSRRQGRPHLGQLHTRPLRPSLPRGGYQAAGPARSPARHHPAAGGRRRRSPESGHAAPTRRGHAVVAGPVRQPSVMRHVA